MRPALDLSILDFGVRRFAKPSRMAADEIRRTAELADRLGYRRYWLAEHHAAGDIWGAPAPMLGYLAAHTQRIRVGIAGTLIAFHDPYDVASDYRLLECLHPGRIDLGIAGGFPSRAPHRDRHDGARDRTVYGRNVEDLVRWCRMRPDPADPASLDEVPVPMDVTVGAPWLLGTGGRSLELATRLGTPLCYSLFHVPGADPSILAQYFDRFQPNAHCPEPVAAIAAVVICGETEAEAQRIRRVQAAELKDRGLPVDIFGSPSQCADQIFTLAHRYGVREVVLHDASHTVPERRRCLELLAHEVHTPRVQEHALAAHG